MNDEVAAEVHSADRGGGDAGFGGGGGGEVAPWPEASRAAGFVVVWWDGPKGTEPDLLGLLWRASYARRLDLEHTLRFLKQTFGWSSPRFRYPEQADLWTWLVVVAAFTQLRLGRDRAWRT